jgi:hypothetical protein
VKSVLTISEIRNDRSAEQPEAAQKLVEAQTAGQGPETERSGTGARKQLGIGRGRVAAKTIRLRDKDHRKFVSLHPCLVCGRAPTDAHHLRFAQPRALGRKVSDEFTVPVCRVHHRELHRHGDEAAWWQRIKVDPLPIALRLWQHTQLNGMAASGRGDIEAELAAATKGAVQTTAAANLDLDGDFNSLAPPIINGL